FERRRLQIREGRENWVQNTCRRSLRGCRSVGIGLAIGSIIVGA
ncbi:hypothetical protein THAOC_07356, partial [Thalassiosira oceanica]